MEENPEDSGNRPINSQNKKCELCTKEVKSEQELKNHKKFIHNLSSENKVNKKILPSTKSALEKHISEVSQKIEIPLETHEATPAVGNCWYEACASLMRLNKMRDISAKKGGGQQYREL